MQKRVLLLTTSFACAVLIAGCGTHGTSNTNAASASATATQAATAAQAITSLARVARLTNLKQPTNYSLDAVSGVTVPRLKGAIEVPTGTSTITLGGWAVDRIHNTLARTVVVVLNGKPVSIAAYGNARPDVATALGNTAFTNVGFNGSFGAKLLKPGVNQLSLWIVNSAGTGYYPSKNYQIALKR